MKCLLDGEAYVGTAAQIAVSEDLTYDAVGNILLIDDKVGSGQRSRSMTYDGLNRLLSSHADHLWGTESYTYDTLNNLRSLTDSNGTKTYNYNANNLLSTISNNGATVHSFTYDAQGNTTAKDSQAMTFDLANRLLSVNGKGDYLYDATGHRVKAVTSSGTTYYAYSSSGQLMWEYDNGSTNGTSYIYLGKKLVASRKATTSVVMGNIDGVTTGTNATINGWACASGLAGSIDVHLYVGGPYGTGTGVAIATANQDSESAVQTACHSSGTKHRFSIPLTEAQRVQYAGKTIYVHGISLTGGDNNLLAQSGTFVIPPSVLAPSSPASITAAAAGDLSNIAVNWSATSNTTSYKTECSTNSGPWATLYTGTGTSASYNGPGDATYQFRASACNANGCSTPTVSSVVTIAHIPPSPASISVPANSTGAVAVSWPATTYATSYQVDHSTNGNWANVWSGTSTSTTVNEGSSGNWSYRVRACNANGCGGYVTSAAVSVMRPPASAPSITGGGTNNSGAYTISWSTVGDAVGYNLMESVNGAAFQQVQFNGATSWSTSGRGNGTYAYEVQGCNPLACGPFSGTTTVTVSLVPSAPPAPTFTTTYHGPTKPTVLVKWTAQSSATRYELMENNTQVYNGSALSYSSLQQPGVTLTYKVRACNAVGCSAYSQSNSVSP